MSRGGWLAGLEELRPRAGCPPSVFEYVVQGARDGAQRRRGDRGLARPSGSARGCCATSPHVDLTVHAARAPPRGAVGRRADDPAARRPPGGRARDGPAAAAAAGVPMVVSSNAGTPFADIGGHRRPLVAAGLPARSDRELAEPLLERGRGRPAPRPSCSPWTRRWSGTKYVAEDRVVWDVVDPAGSPGELRPGLRRRSPGSREGDATSARPTSAWLARARPGCRSW